MNRSYTENRKFDSNKGIYEAFYAEVTAPSNRMEKAFRRMLSGLLDAIRILTSDKAKQIARICAVACSLIGIIGVAGAMELGGISLPAGFSVCALFVGIEFFCLRGKPIFHKRKKSNASSNQI